MWRAEYDPKMRSPVLALEILDTTPEWDRLVAAHDWASRMVPRFRERVRDALGGLGTPYWIQDREFDLHYHLRRVRLAGDAEWAELSSVAEQFMMTPFDRERPPWEAMLVEGLSGGRAGVPAQDPPRGHRRARASSSCCPSCIRGAASTTTRSRSLPRPGRRTSTGSPSSTGGCAARRASYPPRPGSPATSSVRCPGRSAP